MAEDNASGEKPKSRARPFLLALAPIAAIIGGLTYYLNGGRYEETENAALQTGQVGIAADVSGRVISVDVRENQLVHKGDILFRIDGDLYQTDIAGAEAEIAAGRTRVAALRADYQQHVSDMAAGQAKLDFARREAARQRALLAEGIASKSQYDQAQLAISTAREAIDAARAKAENVRANLSGSINAPADAQPSVRRSQAALDRARISLDRTIVRAPQDGVVTRVNQLQPGSYVTAARPVFMLSGTRFWVMANFKEGQLRHMRLGQSAKITVDAFPDQELTGHIASFSPGTGSSFSILPPENATGNWVKVAQRLPVEIALDNVPKGLPLYAGLSATVTVDTGYQRHLFGADTPPTPARAR